MQETDFDLLRHTEIDNVLDFGKVESLGGDGTRDHDVLLTRLERLDRILSLFLGWGRSHSSAPVIESVRRVGTNALLLP